jgi:hypothetical protein
MKYWFFAILLANIGFFLWKFHYGALDVPDVRANAEKQILLLSEVSPPHGDLQQMPAVPAEKPQIAAASLETSQQSSASQPGEATPGSAATAVTDPATPLSPQKPPLGLPNESVTKPSVLAESRQAVENSLPPVDSSKSAVMHSSCYALGIVKNVEALNAVLDRYRSQLDTVQLSSREKRKNDSYLVYYPGGASMEESIATAEMLRSEHGVSDLLVYRSGEMKGAISLGIYSNEQRAKAAQTLLENKGVSAKIMPRYPLESSYAVRLRWNEQQEAAARKTAETLKRNYPATRKMASCE